MKPKHTKKKKGAKSVRFNYIFLRYRAPNEKASS